MDFVCPLSNVVLLHFPLFFNQVTSSHDISDANALSHLQSSHACVPPHYLCVSPALKASIIPGLYSFVPHLTFELKTCGDTIQT